MPPSLRLLRVSRRRRWFWGKIMRFDAAVSFQILCFIGLRIATRQSKRMCQQPKSFHLTFAQFPHYFVCGTVFRMKPSSIPDEITNTRLGELLHGGMPLAWPFLFRWNLYENDFKRTGGGKRPNAIPYSANDMLPPNMPGATCAFKHILPFSFIHQDRHQILLTFATALQHRPNILPFRATKPR